VTVLFHTDVLN